MCFVFYLMRNITWQFLMSILSVITQLL